MCCLVNIVKLFDSKPPVVSVDLLFLIKSNVGWFLLKRADLVIGRIIYTLLVRNYFNTFLLINLQKPKTKISHCSKVIFYEHLLTSYGNMALRSFFSGVLKSLK